MQDFVREHPYAFATPLQKCPKLTFAYDALKERFPAARFALIVRNPHDTIRSFLFRRGLPGDVAELDRPLELLPMQLEGSFIERLAHRWNLAAQVAIDNPGEVVGIRYEDFCADKRAEIDRLAKALGLEPKHDISPWLDVDFKPRSRTGKTPQQFFGDANFERINAICAEHMGNFNYPIEDAAWPG